MISRTRGVVKSMGEPQALYAAAASLRTVEGSTSRAALCELFIPINRWNKLRRPPHKDILTKINNLVKLLEDTKNAKQVFGSLGEFDDGTGAAYLYVESIHEIIKDTDNRFTREMKRYITKANEGIGKKRAESLEPSKAKEFAEFTQKFINGVLIGGNSKKQ